jgi:plasmid stabilization system protein ParE
MRRIPVKVTDEADRDLTLASEWYAELSPTAALNFVEEVMSCFNAIAIFPNGSPRVKGMFRQLPVHGFPFLVLYRPMRDRIIVVRVFHTRQHPRKKFRRKK